MSPPAQPVPSAQPVPPAQPVPSVPPAPPEAPAPPSATALLRAAVRHGAPYAGLVLLLTCATAAAGLALPAVIGRALDLLLAGREAQARPWLGLCAGLTAVCVLLGALDGLVTGTGNARTTAWLRDRVLRQVLAAGPQERTSPGDAVARLTGNAAQAGTVPTALASALAAVITPVGGLVALALTDWRTALVVIAGMPLLALLLRVFIRASGDCGAAYLRAQGQIAGLLSEAVRGIRTITAAGTRDRESARILAPLPELSRQGTLMWRVLGTSTARAAALLPLLQLAVLAVAGLRLADGALSVGGMLAAWRYGVLATGTGVLVGQLNGLVRGRAAAGRLAELERTPVLEYGSGELPPGEGRLEFRGVRLRGLREVDLVIPGGKCTAVVGRTGSGKSALAAVAGRLVDAEAGVVVLDGVPLRSLSRESLRGGVAYAFARPALLGASIADTILLGRGVRPFPNRGFAPDPAPRTPARLKHKPHRRSRRGGPGAEPPTRARAPREGEPPEAAAQAAHAAAHAACADAFIRRLPQGYATPTPTPTPLSGGEAQRLGLARAFAHPGRLLVLDDAMSSLDSATELTVSRALLGAEGTRTRLIVAHRVSTAARADRVVWLDAGRVRAVGRHGDLWRDPDYRAVFDE